MLRLADGTLVLAATDLTNHVACAHLSQQRRAIARGERGKPRPVDDPHAELIRDREEAHEREQLDRLSAECGGHVDLSSDVSPYTREDLEAAAEQTAQAMRKGSPPDLFDLVLFDEAQHLPARTWTAILHEADARAALFTATPFRRDRKQLPGSPVFTYPLGQAMRDGIYAPVDFLPVAVPPGDDPDRALALTAAERLQSQEHQQAGTRLLVRAERVADAEELLRLYADVGVALGLVVGTSAPRTVRRTLDQVQSGELLGFVCVGALVEGFDFPALKIAAYHAPHRNPGCRLVRIAGRGGSPEACRGRRR
jgi:superfamily II DNA or RNA helicase